MHAAMGWPGPVTHRQVRTWRAYREEARNHPGLTETYLMALRADVYRSQGVKADVNKMRLDFGPPPPPVNPDWVLTKDKIAKLRRQMLENQTAGGFKKLDRRRVTTKAVGGGKPVVKDAGEYFLPGMAAKGRPRINPVLKGRG